MDDRRFDQLSRRIAALALPRLPRRALAPLLLQGAPLAGALGLLTDPDDAFGQKNKGNNKNKGASAEKKNKKCKKEGKKCDKKKCKKQDKKCCCKNLKCKNDVCEDENACPTDADFDTEWDEFDGNDTFNLPWGIAVDPDNHVFVTDTNNERVLAFNQNGTDLINEFGSAGEGGNDFIAPRGIGFNENNQGDDRLVVADPEQNDNDDRIRRFSGDPDIGGFGNLINPPIGDETGDNNINPFGVAIDSDDRIWVVNRSDPGLVYLFDRDGDFIADFEPDGQGQLDGPQGIAVFEDDNNDVFVYVADTDNNRVVKFEHVNDNNDGLDFVDETDGGGNEALDAPIGLAVDECGNVWVADSGNDRIAIFDKNLNFIDDFDEDFNLPTGVAIGPDGDTLYVVDSINERIVKFDLS